MTFERLIFWQDTNLEALNTSRVVSQWAENTASLPAWRVSHASEWIPLSAHSGSQRIPIAAPFLCVLHWNENYDQFSINCFLQAILEKLGATRFCYELSFSCDFSFIYFFIRFTIFLRASVRLRKTSNRKLLKQFMGHGERSLAKFTYYTFIICMVVRDFV